MGLVCHDAGAANILIAAFQRNSVEPVLALMEGPAEKLWKSAFPDIRCDVPLNEIVLNTTCLYTGSGWASSLELDAIAGARERGLFCTAVVDHWVNYDERFRRDGHRVWPDRFMVTDSDAFNLACRIFPPEKVLQSKNFYLENQIKKIAAMDKPKFQQLLFICEPMRNNWGRDVEGEFQVLEYFFRTLEQLKIPESVKIMLRLHPSEPEGKYDSAIARTQLATEVSEHLDIADDIAQSSIVVGCNSYGLIVGLAVGKLTYNAIPPWAPTSVLPHVGIKPLSELSFSK